MSQATVQSILEMIDQLSDVDREQLEGRLEQRVEAEWRREAQKARREAMARGIDQEAVDDAIDRCRREA